MLLLLLPLLLLVLLRTCVVVPVLLVMRILFVGTVVALVTVGLLLPTTTSLLIFLVKPSPWITTGSVTLLATIAQGNTVNQREGKSAQLTSVRIRGNQRAGSTTTIADGAQYLVWDRQPNKALAAVADVLTSATSNAFPNRENAQRFVILKNFRCSFAGNTATPAAGTEIIDIDEYVKLPRECVTSYTTADTTGVIGDIISGALLWVSVGDIGAGTASATSTLSFRVNFRDQVYTA